MKPEQTTFAAFLTVGHGKSWMGEILRFHLKVANQLRLNETYDEANFIFGESSSLIFLGKGTAEGRVGQEFIMAEELTPEFVYGLTEKKIILTKTVSLLSHGILAAIEKKLLVVAGISDEVWEGLSPEVFIFLDFEKREFKVV